MIFKYFYYINGIYYVSKFITYYRILNISIAYDQNKYMSTVFLVLLEIFGYFALRLENFLQNVK